MTPHLSEDPWTGVALGLERLTGIRGIVDRHRYCEGNVDGERVKLAIKEIAAGRVEVSKRWLAQLIREMPWYALPELGLEESEESTRHSLGNDWPQNRDATANYWAEKIENGLVVPKGVLIKRDKNEG